MKRSGRQETDLHPVVECASRGELPPWAEVSPDRREHIERVAALMERWARARGEPPSGVARWRAAGLLHDVLRDADPASLRERMGGAAEDFPGAILHGPAGAARLREEGVRDEALLGGVAWHTLGHPDLDDLGRALYCADFLEPGRTFRSEWRARLRERMPGELPAVVAVIVRARIVHLLDEALPVRAETIDFWNRLAEEGAAVPEEVRWDPDSEG